MYNTRSHLWRSSLSAGYLLILLAAYSFMASPGSPTPAVQRATTVVTATSSSKATPTPRVSSTALLTSSAHRQAIYALAWSPNGKLIASGSADTTVSPDGTRIASASDDGTVRIWDAPTDKTFLDRENTADLHGADDQYLGCWLVAQ